MKHSIVERPAPPRRLPPRWMVAPHFWPEIELREQQAAYQITSSVADAADPINDSDAVSILTSMLSR